MKNVLDDLKSASKFGDTPKKESIDQSIQAIEKLTAIKNAYITSGGKVDDFNAMNEQDWTDAFGAWFKAWRELHN